MTLPCLTSVDDVHTAVAKVWDFTQTFPTIRPGTISCGRCGGRFLIRDWKYHRNRTPHTSVPWRCDVSTKCVGCSAVDVFGVVVPQDVWRRVSRWEDRHVTRSAALRGGHVEAE